MKLNVGVSRKVGLPGYSSAGASCSLEVELEAGLLRDDPAAFQAQVREAFAAARHAVDEELARIGDGPPAPPRSALPAPHNGNGRAAQPAAPAARHGPNGHASAPRHREAKPCTENQVRAIRAIARGLGFDLEPMLRDEYGVELPDELTLTQASALIDSLKATSAT
jgi:hypothetical protein